MFRSGVGQYLGLLGSRDRREHLVICGVTLCGQFRSFRSSGLICRHISTTRDEHATMTIVSAASITVIFRIGPRFAGLRESVVVTVIDPPNTLCESFMIRYGRDLQLLPLVVRLFVTPIL